MDRIIYSGHCARSHLNGKRPIGRRGAKGAGNVGAAPAIPIWLKSSRSDAADVGSTADRFLMNGLEDDARDVGARSMNFASISSVRCGRLKYGRR